MNGALPLQLRKDDCSSSHPQILTDPEDDAREIRRLHEFDRARTGQRHVDDGQHASRSGAHDYDPVGEEDRLDDAMRDALIKEGKLKVDTRLDLAYAPLGVGVRSGAPKPDVSTVDAFKRALLNAKSVAHSESGASGTHFKNVIDRLGIAEQMKPKLRPMPADGIAQAVPNGEAEMIVVTLSVIMVPGVDVAGLLPADLQFYNSFAGSVGAKAAQSDAASALLRFLASPAAAPVLKMNGMVAGAP